MSSLTKIFIVLLVVLEILFVSGTIVFVNRTEDFKASATTAKGDLQRATKELNDTKNQMSAVQAEATTQLQAKDLQLSSARNDLDHAQDMILKLNGQIAEQQSNVATLTAGSASTSEALKLVQNRNSTMQDQNASLRAAADKAEQQYTEATIRIGDLENKLQVTEKQRRMLAEQNTDLLGQLDRAGKSGGSAVGNASGPQESQIPVNGQVIDKRLIAGVPYATVNVGGSDQITKNMQLKVIDAQGNRFLGYLTVDTVEPHEATGRLDGPHVGDIQKGNEVRTQL